MEAINNKLSEFKIKISGKKIAVLGIGVSNIPAIKYLVSLGAKVTAHDKKVLSSDKIEELKKIGVEFVFGDNYLNNLNNYEYILRSPGIKPFLPELENLSKDIIVTSEIELLLELCPCKVIGVTGSDGKTTTTTLVSKFLEEAGYKVWLGGNIGIPLFSKLDEISMKDIVVVELSSFQLMSSTIPIDTSIITNISPNHLDYHRSFKEYIEAKANIFKYGKNNKVVLNLDNSYTTDYLQIMKENELYPEIRYFSVVENVFNGVFLKNGYIVSNVNKKEDVVAKISEVKLVGIHNIANICAAASAVIDITGTAPIKKVITTFTGVEHRMEFVVEKSKVSWYNDSIGTSPARTIAGLKAFSKKIILIAGGYDKNIPYDELGIYILEKVKVLILMGKTAKKIEEAVLKAKNENSDLNCDIEIIHMNNLEESVNCAKLKAIEGDIVVMSPASASFDLYKNFEERGDHFKKLVLEQD